MLSIASFGRRDLLTSVYTFKVVNVGLSNQNYTPASNLGYLAPPRTIFHGCQIVHWDPLDGKRRCPQKKNGLGYVKLHGFYANPKRI